MRTIEEAATDYWYDNVANSMTLDEVDETTFEDCFKAGADFALANQWVNVDDRLPEYDELKVVCAWTTGPKPVREILLARLGRFIGCDGEDLCAWYCGDTLLHNDVTHWMPIPEPNTEEK